jgi:hypothetical protein
VYSGVPIETYAIIASGQGTIYNVNRKIIDGRHTNIPRVFGESYDIDRAVTFVSPGFKIH